MPVAGRPPVLADVAGIAQIDGSLVDAGSLSQYGPHHSLRHQRAGMILISGRPRHAP
jgi:hypothetical protein